MSTSKGKTVYISAGMLAAIYAVSIILLYLFEGGIGDRLFYPAIITGVFCVYLIYVSVTNYEKIVLQPLSIYFVIFGYLITCLLLCFPNRYFHELAIIYIVAIPVAMFFGFRYSVVSIVAVFISTVLTGAINWNVEILHAIFISIVCIVAAGRKDKHSDFLGGIIVFVLQGIILCVSGIDLFSDPMFLLKECIVITLNSVLIPLMYRLSLIREQEGTILTETGSVMSVADNEMRMQDSTKTETYKKSQGQETEVDLSKYPLELSYLIRSDCEVAKWYKDNSPRAYTRAIETAEFAKRIALSFGANSELVYAAALYHDINRSYMNHVPAKTVLPEYLYQMIVRINEKQQPASIEELIVLLSNHVLAIYHYIEKNNADISIEKVIENIFNLQLKKGNIISVGISMSIYHKLKREFVNEFMLYLNK